MLSRKTILAFIFSALLGALSCKPSTPDYWEDSVKDPEQTEKPTEPVVSNSDKPRYIWIDSAANFPDFANSKENIARDIALAKDAGFTDLVVEVRPTMGDALFKTSQVDQVKYLYAWVDGVYSKVERTATWDYLQAFVDEARNQGMRIHAAINTFVGGNLVDGGIGLLYRDADKAKNWATCLNLATGVTNVMDVGSESTKFLNPASPEVQDFLCNLLKDLAKYDLDGIVLDRGRFLDLRADFSDISRKQFESYIGTKINNWPGEVLPVGTTYSSYKNTQMSKQWLEFRAKVIHDFIVKAGEAVRSVNSNIKFGVYVGGWYSQYYDVGVNWAAPTYDASKDFAWASTKYKNYGYADHVDQILIGAYASPSSVYGSREWTMQGFCALAHDKIRKACPLVVGGPDVGNWDYDDKFTQQQENQAIVNSVKACLEACDGYFLFDMIHLKKANQWEYAKKGIELAIN